MVFILNPGSVSVAQYADAAQGKSSSSSSAAASGSSSAATSSGTRASSASGTSSSASAAAAATSMRKDAAQVAKPVVGAGVVGVLLAALLA